MDAFRWRLTFLIALVNFATALHIVGQWNSAEFATVLSRFGVQKTDELDLKRSRGFIYGNVTAADGEKLVNRWNEGPFLLLIVNKAKFSLLYEQMDVVATNETCRRMFATFDQNEAYDRRCFTKGRNDLFRKVPCPFGKICGAEDQPNLVVPQSQFTFKIRERVQPGFWYLLLVGCQLDENCNWTVSTTSKPRLLSYDVWLVNGEPAVMYTNPFEHQFSFEDQDTAEIYLAALFLNLILLMLQWKAVGLLKAEEGGVGVGVRRAALLFACCLCQTTATLCCSAHVLIFASNGTGSLLLRWTGDMFRLAGLGLISLLLLLFAHGWTVTTAHLKQTKLIVVSCFVLSTLHVVLFVWNSEAVDLIQEIDIFETWPGWGIIGLRASYVLWFIVAIRRTIQEVVDFDKAQFLTHVGAGFAVWFVYLPLLGVVASQISILWRFKVILGIRYLADFLATAILIHLTWPRSTNRRFFLIGRGRNRRERRAEEDEPEDFETELISKDSRANTMDDEGEEEISLNDQRVIIPVDPVTIPRVAEQSGSSQQDSVSTSHYDSSINQQLFSPTDK